MPRDAALPAEFQQVLLETYAVNEYMNQLILQHLDARAWRAKPPGHKTRTIAAIIAHVHNVRCKWLRLSAPHLKPPEQLNRAHCTLLQATASLVESARCCSEMLSDALKHQEGRVTEFRRDGWARPWPAGAAMFSYMVIHDAHHRGQVFMLAQQVGFPLPDNVNYGIWTWEKLWRECGFTRPR
ncbi:MAG TPA: DinB family protein [Terriglobia bacterium]|nr:DinB family protein [Terriglobia bacterium]